VPDDVGDPSLKKIVALATAARTYHATHTLPWSDDGWRLLPVSEYWKAHDTINDAMDEYTHAADSWASAYIPNSGTTPRTSWDSSTLADIPRPDEYAPIRRLGGFTLKAQESAACVYSSMASLIVSCAFQYSETGSKRQPSSDHGSVCVA